MKGVLGGTEHSLLSRACMQLVMPMPIMIWLAVLVEAAIGNWLDMIILLLIQFVNASIGWCAHTAAAPPCSRLLSPAAPGMPRVGAAPASWPDIDLSESQKAWNHQRGLQWASSHAAEVLKLLELSHWSAAQGPLL